MVHFSTQATTNLPVLQSLTDQFQCEKSTESKHAIKTVSTDNWKQKIHILP